MAHAPLAPFSLSSLLFDLLAPDRKKSDDYHAPEECDYDGRGDAEGLHGVLEGLREEYRLLKKIGHAYASYCYRPLCGPDLAAGGLDRPGPLARLGGVEIPKSANR